MHVSTGRTWALVCAAALLASPMSITFAADHDGHGGDARNAYAVTPLVTDTGTGSTHADANLVNGWGVAFNPTGPVWLSDNGSGKSTLYDGTGNPIPLVVSVPAAPSSGAAWGSPTGIVFNASSQFVVSAGTGTALTSAPAKFLFASEDGIISGWAPTVDLHNARIAVDNSAAGAVYKGLAESGSGSTFELYATDFHNRRVDVFDGNFQPVNLPGAFQDPDVPADYAPFGIQNVNGDLYVTYAKQDPAQHDNVAGAGLGFVDVYDPMGRLIRHFAAHGALNAPWGVALAPRSFGRFGGALLIGNFGDGVVNAYDARTGEHIGKLRARDGRVIHIDGLWGLAFGDGVDQQPIDTLFYAAGPGGEQHGAYGAITSVGSME